MGEKGGEGEGEVGVRGGGEWGGRERQTDKLGLTGKCRAANKIQAKQKQWNMWQQFISCGTEVQVESKTVLKISVTNYETYKQTRCTTVTTIQASYSWLQNQLYLCYKETTEPVK